MMLATRNFKITSGLLGSFTRRYSSGAAIKTLVLAEHNNVSLGPSTLNAIAAARAVGGSVSVVVAGWQCEKAAAAAAQAEGVDKVRRVEHKSLAHPVAETLSPLLLAMQEIGKYSHIVAPATTFGKNVIPRVAAKLDVSPVAEVVEIKAADTFVRPIYAGNALSTVKSSDNVKLLTIRTAAFPKVPLAASPAIIEDVPPPAALSDTPVLSEWVSDELSVSTRPELASARVVVAGGRGLKSGENFKLLEELADKLNGAVGASRAAVDAGYVPNDLQIGQTGKVVAPELYIGVGISGAIQHLAGMKDSKVIVAINKDPDAPIFQVADYGLVGDLFTLMPEISAAVAKKS